MERLIWTQIEAGCYTVTTTTTMAQAAHTPRPLHLVTNSTTSTPTTDEFSSPTPPSSFRHPKRFSMMATTTYSSPTTPSTPSAQTKASRRKSSIGYFPPDSRETPRRGSLIRRNSLGTLNENFAAAASVGHKGSCGDRPSVLSLPASAVPGAESAPDTPVRDRSPLTLTEKYVFVQFLNQSNGILTCYFIDCVDRHADLLRFIAQKESKCLELRSQLAIHEAELVECAY